MFRKITIAFLYLLLTLSAGLFFAYEKSPAINLYVKQLLGIAPCQKPLTYSLGAFDPKFGINQADFLSDVEKATAIWENAVNKNLFEYTPDGKLKINLTYDYRQDATDKLKSLGLSIENTKDSYDKIKAEYEKLLAKYNSDNNALNDLVANFKGRKDKYDADVSYWNKKGGAPKDTYNTLTAERSALQALAQQINNSQNALNKEADEMNGIVNTLNQIASQINLGVKNYNQIGASTGEEFNEGLYIYDSTGARIEIYQFNNQDQLVRLLAHELGHSLGLEHVDNPNAIMYKLNESKNLTPTANDISELKAICHIK